MGELTSTAAALEDSGAFVRTEEELSAEVHYGRWKALKGDCQDVCLPMPEGGTKRCSLSTDS